MSNIDCKLSWLRVLCLINKRFIYHNYELMKPFMINESRDVISVSASWSLKCDYLHT